ncbi:hypothetical protein IACHDJAJ_00088 [Aeromonas phage vB_AdhS_TS3]|nr:hypothetical protein IACHDJAJ_00088 [Aeromonas phage vB_AdhS_TS3]
MKVLVLFEEIPESSMVMLIDMTAEEFAELSPAHGTYSGCYSSSDHKDAINQALCRWNFAIQFLQYPDDEFSDSDKEWMDECGVDHSWYNRFEGRVLQLTDMHTAGKFDAFINTGLAM